MLLLRTRWSPGPDAGTDQPVLVTITDYTSNTHRDLPGIVRAGLRLRRAWPALDGAVGVWLWTIPRQRRAGSVAVWTGTEALRRFVGLPDHVAIMRHYHPRGRTRSTRWEHATADPAGIWSDAHRQLRQA
ncbi:hypothetical protein [Saccharopolyspora taberi]|uniref:hypothetical protein n=1 Tax=Saccharopolyspora taberi TaxID=60895 RepID=UPI0031DD9FAA